MGEPQLSIPIVHVDVFTGDLFGGNPAAICLLENWLPDSLMQSIAAENNLSETAFLVKHQEGHWDLRWFTPITEVDLCGHATLAAGAALFWQQATAEEKIEFRTRSGALFVSKKGKLYALDLPAIPALEPYPLIVGLGAEPLECWRASNSNVMALFDDENAVRNLNPDFQLLAELGKVGVIATASGKDCDFVSRFFAPGCGVNEDPATGSSHCTLTPYWRRRLNKTSLYARQLSARGGELFCEDRGDRVTISGGAVLYMQGFLSLTGLLAHTIQTQEKNFLK